MATMDPPREIRFCRSTDVVELAMARYGAGPPLVKAATWLTHVESDHASPFERAMIRAVSPYRRFVTYDARGSGRSSPTRATTSWSGDEDRRNLAGPTRSGFAAEAPWTSDDRS
jgi:hypothetical protein